MACRAISEPFPNSHAEAMIEAVRLPSRLAGRTLIRSIWVFSACRRFAAKVPADGLGFLWISLDSLVQI
jgi:hypothetical protein